MRSEEVSRAVTKKGGYSQDEVTVGPLRRTSYGLCTVVVRCPLEVVREVTRKGSITVGWSAARVEILRQRKLQYYRCLEIGHVVATCQGEDRSKRY